MECTLECNQCKNKYCFIECYDKIIIKEELKKQIKECNVLIRMIKNGDKFYGVTLRGLKHKKNILTEEMMKYEKY